MNLTTFDLGVLKLNGFLSYNVTYFIKFNPMVIIIWISVNWGQCELMVGYCDGVGAVMGVTCGGKKFTSHTSHERYLIAESNPVGVAKFGPTTNLTCI